MRRARSRWQRRAEVAVLAIALVLATGPVWRLVGLGPQPTLDELLALRCAAAP